MLLKTSYKKKYEKNDIIIIGREKYSFDELIKLLTDWHKELTDIILFPNNLYYFITNNFDSDYYLDELSDRNIEYVRTALGVIIDKPEKFYSEYSEKSANYQIVSEVKTIEELKDVVTDLDIKKVKIEGLNLEKAKLRIQQSLCTDYCFGVFGEMLFYCVAENILNNKLVLSKVELITAPILMHMVAMVSFAMRKI